MSGGNGPWSPGLARPAWRGPDRVVLSTYPPGTVGQPGLVGSCSDSR